MENRESENKKDLPEEIIKLEAGLKKTAEWLRQAGLPVDDECRLVMDEYTKAGFDLAEIETDKNRVKNAEDDFAEKLMRQGGVEKSFTLGEQMERFATVLMARFFKDLAQKDEKQKPLAVFRTSRFDDIVNHVDYAIFDTNNGAIMGAIDVTVGEEDNAIYDNKERRITDANIAGEGRLKYGLDIDKNDPQKKVVLKSREKVPVFLLNLPKKDLDNYLKKVDYAGAGVSKLENKIIDKFLKSIVEQIEIFEEAGWAKGDKESFEKIKAIYNQRMMNI